MKWKARFKTLFTLSATVITVNTLGACGTDNTNAIETTKAFNWRNNAIDQEYFDNNNTVDYKWLLDNINIKKNGSFSKELMEIINKVTLQSYLDKSETLKEEYAAIITECQNKVIDKKNSLKAKEGRNWIKVWQNFLDQSEQGGTGKKDSGSEKKYIKTLINAKLPQIVNKIPLSYELDYDYYSSDEIKSYVKPFIEWFKINDADPDQNFEQENKLWIIEKSTEETKENLYKKLRKIAKNEPETLIYQEVAKRENDKQDGKRKTNWGRQVPYLFSSSQLQFAQIIAKKQKYIAMDRITIDLKPSDSKETINDMIEKNKTILFEIIKNIRDQKSYQYAKRKVNENKNNKVETEFKNISSSNPESLKEAELICKVAKVFNNNRFNSNNSSLLSDLPVLVNDTIDLSTDINQLYNADDVHALLFNIIKNKNGFWKAEDITNYGGTDEDKIIDEKAGNKVIFTLDSEFKLHIIQLPGIDYKPTTQNFCSKAQAIETTHLYSTSQKNNEFDFATAEEIMLGILKPFNIPNYLAFQLIYDFYKNFKNDIHGNNIGNDTSASPFNFYGYIKKEIGSGGYLENWWVTLTNAYSQIKYMDDQTSETKEIASKVKNVIVNIKAELMQKLWEDNLATNLKTKLDEIKTNEEKNDKNSKLVKINYDYETYLNLIKELHSAFYNYDINDITIF